MAETCPLSLSDWLATDALPRLRQAAPRYQQAEPFPHLVLDGFFDEARLRGLGESYYDGLDARWHRFNDASREVKLQIDQDEHFPPPVRALLHALNSAPFLRELSELTGIPGLVPDPYHLGGGMHQILPGGKLAIHADYNLHPVMRLNRRLNLLVYLNEDWQEDFGGHLELWDREMQACCHRIAPLFNRLVVFQTDSSSYHGHPDPLRCPEHRSRRSLALYYYTQEGADDLRASGGHSTLFKARPGERFGASPYLRRVGTAGRLVTEAAKLLVPEGVKQLLRRAPRGGA
ncbi:MAG: 2OG-Fe(II) oxygenase [Candidatus Sericytochromatia bacterium]|nr:2OG-Fe(II) oxygenase [Candidatus Sericytochromatia bacterium]